MGKDKDVARNSLCPKRGSFGNPWGIPCLATKVALKTALKENQREMMPICSSNKSCLKRIGTPIKALTKEWDSLKKGL